MREVALIMIVLAAAAAAGPAQAAGDDSGDRTPAATAPRAAAPAVNKAGPPAAASPVRRTADADRPDRRTTGRGHVPPIFRDATEEEVADILAFTGEHMPWLRQELEKVRQSDPDRFRQMCRRLRFEISQLRSMKERDAAAFQKAIEERQLKMRSQDLAAKIRATTDPKEKEALAAHLRQILEKVIDAEMVTREANIRGIEERLESLRKELKERATHRQEILQRRFDETLKGNSDSILSPPNPERAPPKK